MIHRTSICICVQRWRTATRRRLYKFVTHDRKSGSTSFIQAGRKGASLQEHAGMQRTKCHKPQVTSHARTFDPASKHLIGKDEMIVRAETTIDIRTDRTPGDIVPEQQSANRARPCSHSYPHASHAKRLVHASSCRPRCTLMMGGSRASNKHVERDRDLAREFERRLAGKKVSRVQEPPRK